MLVQVVAKPMMLADRQQWQGTKTTLVTEWRKKKKNWEKPWVGGTWNWEPTMMSIL